MKNRLVLIGALVILSCGNNYERVLYSSSVNGNSDIFIMDANGENKIAITDTASEEWGPTWINENEISFLRQTGDSISRVKLDLRSKEESKLKHPSNCILDDKNMLYSTSNNLQLYSCRDDIFIFNPKNGETLNITEDLTGTANYPSWSRAGKSVIYTSNHLGTNNLFQYDIESEKRLQFTDSDFNDERGELSPDGKLLVYSSDYFGKGNQDIVIKNLESGEIENISRSSGMELIARFSTNGKDIFYGSNKDGNWEIYSYNLETKDHYRLTNNKEFDGDPRIFKR